MSASPGPMFPMMVSGPIDMSASDLEAARRRIPVTVHRSTLLSWQVATTGFATALVFGWLCIIALLILQERWQLVLVAWMLLYAAAHFAYCYCKRNNVNNLKRQLRLRIVARISDGHHTPDGASTEKKDDKPPSYIDVCDMEQPPPTYIMAVKHKGSSCYSVENESRKGDAKASAKNSSETASNNSDLILNPQSAFLNSAALPFAMAIPFSPSTISLTSLASVHSQKSTRDKPDEPTIKTLSESVSSSKPSKTASEEQQ